MILSAAASFLSVTIIAGKEITSRVIFIVASFAVVLAITVAIVSRLSRERRRGTRLKDDVQAVYLVALREEFLGESARNGE